MEMGRHTELAAIKYQERGSELHHVYIKAVTLKGYKNSALYFQRQSAIEYATARKLMGIEE